MRIVIFTHSLISDWNHGNAHFLRGVATELLSRGHTLRIFEPRDGWSYRNLVSEHGEAAANGFYKAYPQLRSEFYDGDTLNMEDALAGADLAIVHEWNSPELVRRAGEYRASHPALQLFFHDTHHRSATDPDSMAAYDLRHYDGVLAYGGVIRDIYRQQRWADRVWTWHEAADTRVFYPRHSARKSGDLVWIGNWGDDERGDEIREFLIEPVKALGLKACVYGVRYPDSALRELEEAGIEYRGWLPNYRVPEVFSRYAVTVHIPRRPYVRALPGIPTIRPFEALACAIPLVSAPWDDTEGLFRNGRDFLMARDGGDMIAHLSALLSNPRFARTLAESGLETIRSSHTCAHRVDQLLEIARSVNELAVVEGAN
ncbi:MAG TPA: glycosyltransferase [Candidatus Sulfopaludibacter sp.]|jgi:spore maturation protein CgeB|nr:glycosyltransferase [Candidatus Sulfopaludibacter sp.]